MCIVVLPGGVSMHHMCALNPQKPEESVRSPRTRVADSCESPCGCWKPNQGSLQEQQVLFHLCRETFFTSGWIRLLLEGSPGQLHVGEQRDRTEMPRLQQLPVPGGLAQARFTWEDGPPLRNCLLQIYLWASLWSIFLFSDGWATPRSWVIYESEWTH